MLELIILIGALLLIITGPDVLWGLILFGLMLTLGVGFGVFLCIL